MRITRIERTRPDHDDNENRAPIWLVGITDLTTLLLAFFILLFATTQAKTTSVMQAAESLRTQFSGSQQVTDTRSQAGHKDAKLNWENLEHDPGLDLNYLYSLINQYTTGTPELERITLWQSDDSIVLSFPSELCFNPGEATLSDYGKKAARQVAQMLAKLPNTVHIVGHADKTPIGSDGLFSSNWHLSLARAHAVTQALQEEGYTLKIETRGRGTTDADTLPWNLPRDLPEAVRNEKARRVDIHVSLLKS